MAWSWVVGFSVLLGCSGEELTAPEPEAVAEAPTHVVLITLDTTRADALGIYGQPLPTTPHIDRMSGEGVRFSQAMSAAPNTLPSHATILTGKFPYAHGARSNSGYVLTEANETLAELLSRHGFATAAEIAAPVIGRQTQLDQGFTVYRDTLSANIEKKVIAMLAKIDDAAGDIDRSTVIQLDERMAADITNHGIEFIRAHRTGKSFLWLHYFDPHIFYAPPPEFRGRFPSVPYLAEVSYVDSEVGRILNTIRGLGLDASTLVVLTADHGEGLGQHGEESHSNFVYETTMRVPLVMWGPSTIRRGSLVDSLVRTADIAPTILQLLGLSPLEGIQGQSLLPLITGTSRDLELTGYGESAELLAFGSSMIRSVREGRWKYIHKPGPELYDVVSDPREESNLALGRPEIVERLRTRMAELISDESIEASGAEVPVDAEMRARLGALGYAATTPNAELRDSLSSMTLRGTDPSELVDDIRLLGQALGAKKRRRYAIAEQRFESLWQKFQTGGFGLSRAEALIGLGQFDRAVGQLEDVVAVFPEDPQYRVALGDVLIKAERREEARQNLFAVLAMSHCDAKARILLAHLAFLEKSYRDQHEILRVGSDECPRSEDILNNYAYALATCPDASQRDGAEAWRVAMVVMEMDGGDNPGHIDTLAAAHAELGDFEAATAASKRAIEIAKTRTAHQPSRENAQLAELKAHLAVFAAGHALRDPPDEGE